ncbi:UPF0187-domain-containing protein [Heliocybe sulcata]|uniref:UPF0187-domain-containing protein n=1 Tax=Heliocybe sulcata TaxID=5364 RepID=A0A5C3NDS2_9AGAM|nr:UPF0187-domain-containing protein [Heliocybe sulcata]
MPHDPLFLLRLSIKKLKATVIVDIWPQVLFFACVATMVSLVSDMTTHSLAISNQMLTVLGTVLGLVVSFRTSSAYERYQEGRKTWTNIFLASRNLAHMIWNHVPFDRDPPKDDKKDASKPAGGNDQPQDKKDGNSKDAGEDADDSDPTVASEKQKQRLEAAIEKKTMINLVQAFSVSVKHFLRGEAGIYYEDLYPLVCFLPRYATHPPEKPSEEDLLPLWRAADMQGQAPGSESRHDFPQAKKVSSDPGPHTEHEDGHQPKTRLWQRQNKRRDSFDPEKALPAVASDKPLRPARNPPKYNIFDYIKDLFDYVIASRGKGDWRTARPSSVTIESNVPLEITLFLSSYLAWLLKKGLLTPAMGTGITNNLASLQEAVVNLERIRSTPLPFAYQAHLRMTIWLYLFFLPFQIYSAFKYLTIPATAFASFLLLGFLEIGQEIENPFNYDDNDLDLDGFCLSIQRELHEITAHSAPDPNEYIFSTWNQPFAPGDRRTAEEMLNGGSNEYLHPDTGVTSVRRTMLRSWRDVDEMTRDWRAGHRL